MVSPQHPWVLTGPWYRWPKPGAPASGRVAAPALQKYASPRFVDEFMKEPQRSLKYRAEDLVQHIRGKALVTTGVRKLFLDSHSRHYLVVCELHCDAPGFPGVGRDQVCEAGFVVRRRSVRVPAAAQPAVQKALGAYSMALARVNLALAASESTGGALSWSEAIAKAVADKQSELAEELKQSQALLALVAGEHQISTRVQGWVPARDHKQVGAWVDITDDPTTEIEEQVVRLFPLVPAPGDTRHSARGRTLYFGVVPTGSADTDALGNPRFDERSLYEVRCFVRRHRDCCPRRSSGPCCKGELVWARASERYQIAPHFDLDGTSHRPVTIQLPDLNVLAAQANSMAFGRGMGVRMVSPQSLEFKIQDDGQPYAGQVSGVAAICSFAIPLITIVASFVFRLFLPIVVFTFQLWFLLRLKFCVPPSLSLDVDLAAALEADLEAGLEIEAEVDAKIDAAFAVGLTPTKLATGLKYHVDPADKARLLLDMGTDFSGDAPPGFTADGPRKRGLPTLVDGLEYHERLEVPTP